MMRVYQRKNPDDKPLDHFDPERFEAVAEVEGDDLDAAWRATCSNTPGGWQKAAIGNPAIRMLKEIPLTAVCFTREGDVVQRGDEYFRMTWNYHGGIVWMRLGKPLAVAPLAAATVPVEAKADAAAARVAEKLLPAPAAVPVGETMRLF